MSILEFRKKHGLTQQEMAEHAEVSTATISRAENGSRIDPDEAAKIERFLNYEINLRELLKIKDVSHIKPFCGGEKAGDI